MGKNDFVETDAFATLDVIREIHYALCCLFKNYAFLCLFKVHLSSKEYGISFLS